MKRRVLVAGATGAVGKPLVLLLLAQGYEVWGTTRSSEKATSVERTGARAIVVDVFDAGALERAVASANPETLIHQLTDLPPGLDPARMAEAVPRNARIRSEGTANLVAAARAAGTRRLVSQSIAWRPQGISAQGVAELERLTLGSPPLEGIVLRYGHLYGPGTGRETPSGDMPLHVDAAASAALLALEKGRAGIYEIAEPNPHVSIDKARRELGWDPYFRSPSGTK
ncbi:MAG TPA: NAD(P)-dependent oxidoreductase [Burkholderiales bacterium]|jgi:nucleoside-diphosphate-sugar epimerase